LRLGVASGTARSVCQLVTIIMKIGSQEYAAPLGRGFRAGFSCVSLSIALGRGRKMREACMSHRRPKTNLVGQAEGPSQQGLRHDQQAMRNAGLVVETIPLSYCKKREATSGLAFRR